MYFNSQFFPQFGQSGVGGVASMMGGSHSANNTSMQHSMNMLYMDSIQRQDPCSPGRNIVKLLLHKLYEDVETKNSQNL